MKFTSHLVWYCGNDSDRVRHAGGVAPMEWPLPGGPATPPLKRSKRTLNAVTGEDRDSPSGSYDPDESPQNTAQVCA